jgi:sarcosine oxidase, subunit beta
MTGRSDVAIIGGGIVGASAALALRRMGMTVTLLERGFCGTQASGVNYGGVRRQGRPFSQLPLSQRAHGIWAELRQVIGIDGEYVRCGHLKIARSQTDLESLEGYRARAADFDLDLQMVSRSELRANYPWLAEHVAGASFCPEDGQANPRLVAPAFARAARKLGAIIHEQTAVEDLLHDGREFTLRSKCGLEVQAPVLLNCAGAWSRRIAQRFGEDVPLESAHPAMVVTEPLPPFMDVNLGAEGGGIYARQAARGNCVIGGARGYPLDEERSRPGSRAIATILAQAAAFIPRLRSAWIIRSWSGTEGYLPDRQPVIGPSATTTGLFHAFGFSGAGFQIGPAVGEVLAELVRDGRTPTPIDAFSITRFKPSS